jgi:hypothetical protein
MGAMALHGYSSMELKSRSFTSKEPHVAREPQVADPWTRRIKSTVKSYDFIGNLTCDFPACSLVHQKLNYGVPP